MTIGPMISDDLIEYLACGVDVYIATRDAQLVPESMLGMGVRVLGDRKTVTVYAPNVTAARTLQNLQPEAGAPVAITFCHPPTGRAVQLKGRCTAVRPSTESDRQLQEVFRSALIASFATIGVPRAQTRGLRWWPSTAIDVEVSEVFRQTPGPNAGEPLRGSILHG